MKGLMFLADGSVWVMQPDELEEASHVESADEAMELMKKWAEKRRTLLSKLGACGDS